MASLTHTIKRAASRWPMARFDGAGASRGRALMSAQWLTFARRGLELGAVLAAAVATGKIIGTVVWPLPAAPVRIIASATPRPVIVNPFGAPLAPEKTATGDAPVAAEETQLNLTLYGTWVDPVDQKLSAAIIGTPDGKQKAYHIGEAICCGATLQNVYAREARILRDGAVEALRLPNTAPNAAGAENTGAQLTADAPPTVSAGNITETDLARLVTLSPSIAPDGRLEFILRPAGDAAAFAALGLRENDVVVSVNGKAAPGSAAELSVFLGALKNVSKFTVTVRRNGAEVPVTFSLAGPTRREG